MIVVLITIALILIFQGVVSRPLDAQGITSAMIFTAAGLAVGGWCRGWVVWSAWRGDPDCLAELQVIAPEQ
jgi:hypothetical protein